MLSKTYYWQLPIYGDIDPIKSIYGYARSRRPCKRFPTRRADRLSRRTRNYGGFNYS